MGAIFVFILVTMVSSCVAQRSSSSHSNRGDTHIELLLNSAMHRVIKGIPHLDIEPSDPMIIDSIEGNFPTLKFKKLNNTITGLMHCSIRHIKISHDAAMTRFVLECPRYVESGDIEIDGYLLYQTVTGNGQHKTEYGKHVINVYALLQQVKGLAGDTHFQIGDFSLDVKTIGSTKYTFEDLYNGNQILTDRLERIAEENWEDLSYFSDEPLWYPIMSKLFHNLNKYLLTVPVEKLL